MQSFWIISVIVYDTEPPFLQCRYRFFRSGCIPQELSDYNVYMLWLLKCLTNVSSFIINKCTYIGSDNPVNRYVKKILMCMVMFKCLSI